MTAEHTAVRSSGCGPNRMGASPPATGSEFTDGWIQKGEEKGKAEGEARAKAQDILKVLEARALQPTAGQRKQVTDCTDISQLDAWFDRALTASSAAQVFQD